MATNLISHIAREFISGGASEAVDVITFVEAQWGLGLKLLPVQKFMLRAFYGLELDDTEKTIRVPDILNEKVLYTFTEKKFLEFLYSEGRCNTDKTEGKLFHELVLALGRRATKSTTSACISNYELYKLVKMGDPAKFFGFPPNTEIVILNVASTDDQAGIVFDMTQALAMKCPYMKQRVMHQTQSYFDIKADSDIRTVGKERASLVSMSGGSASNALRGRNAIVVIMDELAFFCDKESSRYSGREVYKALTPSVASFGQYGKVITISSPYAKFGRFYERYIESFDEPDYSLMFKMYTAMVNPTVPSEVLRATYRRDKTGFMCEFGAEFSDSVMAWIDDETEFRKCISNRVPNTKGVKDFKYFVGIDLGFKNDGTAVVIVHKEKNKIVLDYADVWFSGDSDVWGYNESIYRNCTKYSEQSLIKMADIVNNEIKPLARWFPIKNGIFDQSNGYGLQEVLHAAGFAQFEMVNFTDTLNNDVYTLVKRLYGEQLLDLYDHPVLIPEMLSLEAEKRGKGKILVRAPERGGAHDDISDAFARAVWSCYNNSAGRTVNMVAGLGGGTIPSAIRASLPACKPETMATHNIARLKKHGEYTPRSVAGPRLRSR